MDKNASKLKPDEKKALPIGSIPKRDCVSGEGENLIVMRKIFLGLTVVLSIIVLFSCSKNDEISSNQDQTYEKPTMQNPTPIYQYGVSHNLRMDFIANNPNFLNLTLEEIFNYGKNYSDEYFTCSSETDYVSHVERRELCFYLIENPSNTGNALYNLELIPVTIIGLVDSLSVILDNAMDYETGVYKTSNEFTQEVENFESHIINHYDVVYDDIQKTGNEYAFLLCAASIAKNSYSYWMDAATNSNHLWSKRLDQVTYFGGIDEAKAPEWLKKIWRGIKVAAVDTWGLITARGCWEPEMGYDNNGNYTTIGATFNLNRALELAGDQSSNVP